MILRLKKYMARRDLNEGNRLRTNLGSFNWAPSNMAGTVELFFKDLKFKRNFHSDEVANIEFLGFNMVLENALKGEFIDSTLIIATPMVRAKKQL